VYGDLPNWERYTPTQGYQQSVTAPTAGAVIVTSGDIPEGLWEVKVETSYGGTPSTIDDMELWINGAKHSQLTVTPVANVAPSVRIYPVLRLARSPGVQVKATAGGAGGTVYRAALIITPVATLSQF
jgi:hypothetical protein